MNIKTNKFLMVYNLLGIALCLIGNIYLIVISEFSPLLYVGELFMLIAMVSALLYIFSNYKKEGAMHLRRFLHFYAASELASILYIVNLGDPVKSIIIASLKIVIFGLLLILSSTKNLGKEKSLLFIRTILVVNLLMLVMILLLNHGMIRNGDLGSTTLLVCIGSNFTLSMSALLCIYAKYLDKEKRGRKN